VLLKYLAIILCAFTPLLQAQSLTAAFGRERPPFVFKVEGQWQGIEVDIVTAVLKAAGHQITKRIHVSNRRLLLAVPNMHYDMAVSVNGIDSDRGSVFYSDNFVTFKNVAVSKKADNIVVNSMADLVDYDVIAWQNAMQHLGPQFNQLFSAKNAQNRAGSYREYTDQKKQNRLFWLGRTEVILVDKNIFLWNKKLLSDQYKTDVELTFHDVFPATSDYQVAFKDPNIRDQFNQNLDKLRASGEYQKILQRYLR